MRAQYRLKGTRKKRGGVPVASNHPSILPRHDPHPPNAQRQTRANDLTGRFLSGKRTGPRRVFFAPHELARIYRLGIDEVVASASAVRQPSWWLDRAGRVR